MPRLSVAPGRPRSRARPPLTPASGWPGAGGREVAARAQGQVVCGARAKAGGEGRVRRRGPERRTLFAAALRKALFCLGGNRCSMLRAPPELAVFRAGAPLPGWPQGPPSNPSGCRNPLSGLDRGPVPGRRGFGAWHTPGGRFPGPAGGGGPVRQMKYLKMKLARLFPGVSPPRGVSPRAHGATPPATGRAVVLGLCLPLGQSRGPHPKGKGGGVGHPLGNGGTRARTAFPGSAWHKAQVSHSVHHSPEVATIRGHIGLLPPEPDDNCCSGQLRVE